MILEMDATILRARHPQSCCLLFSQQFCVREEFRVSVSGFLSLGLMSEFPPHSTFPSILFPKQGIRLLAHHW